MISKILLPAFIIMSVFCNGQKNSISDEEIYEVINFVLKDGTVKYHKDLNIITEDPSVKTDDYFNEKVLKKFFDNKNGKFILEQFSSSKDFLLSYKYISNMQIIHIDKMLSFKKMDKGIWSFLAEKYRQEGFVFIGKPLFTLDKKQAIISYGYYCGGLCGRGSKVILKKVKNTWVIEKEISGFIS